MRRSPAGVAPFVGAALLMFGACRDGPRLPAEVKIGLDSIAAEVGLRSLPRLMAVTGAGQVDGALRAGEDAWYVVGPLTDCPTGIDLYGAEATAFTLRGWHLTATGVPREMPDGQQQIPFVDQRASSWGPADLPWLWVEGGCQAGGFFENGYLVVRVTASADVTYLVDFTDRRVGELARQMSALLLQGAKLQDGYFSVAGRYAVDMSALGGEGFESLGLLSFDEGLLIHTSHPRGHVVCALALAPFDLGEFKYRNPERFDMRLGEPHCVSNGYKRVR